MEELLHSYLHGLGSLDAVRTAEDFHALCAAVEHDRAGRLRWKLRRALALAPWEGAAGRDAYLYAAAQLCADRAETLGRMCPACRERAEREACPICGAALPTVNPAFDENRYEELKQYDPAL